MMRIVRQPVDQLAESSYREKTVSDREDVRLDLSHALVALDGARSTPAIRRVSGGDAGMGGALSERAYRFAHTAIPDAVGDRRRVYL